MKIRLISAIILSFLLFSCNDDEVSKPQASMTVEKTDYSIHESVVFTFTGEGQQISIFTGDKGHEYDLLSTGNTGFVVNKGIFSYAYKEPGEYKVTVVASNYNDNASLILHDTYSLTIKVVDSDINIKSISCPKVYYDEIMAEDNGEDWLIRLPQKILFSGKVLTVAASQRLAIALASDSTKLSLDGASFSTTKSYDLTKSISLGVVANSGVSANYKLRMLRIPEFGTFSINGVEATLVRSEFNYDKMVLKLSLPKGTDLKSLKPSFTLLESQQAIVNGEEQSSGISSVDFSSSVVYTLVNTHTEKSALKATSEVTVVVTTN